ncbi:SRPBCC domain-containing protein [Leifsonia kafniensis]|uniref:SRPBCC domain-containing protein n=1 Tax=Leifsonia kafniensis TaxID=475957 RepID=A0ABP7L1G3_9MICO
MTVLSSEKDLKALTLTFVAEFNADAPRVWQLWEDPRQLERWWGPPTYPATFERHEFREGGNSRYYMTGPEGEKPRGWWAITEIDAPRRFVFDMGFSGDDGEPDASLPAQALVTLEEHGDRTRMTIVSTFLNPDQMEQMIAMGMEEGLREALGQIDALLAESVSA